MLYILYYILGGILILLAISVLDRYKILLKLFTALFVIYTLPISLTLLLLYVLQDLCQIIFEKES